ncbi:MAG TPA: GNAT family N-acetyltransferase [Trinickia sp.]|uniref:GNAT family N-acetyltransferase n=1 Tax=Trinickia sp. TaxID=2571163 RepID=UPI002F423991
MDPLLIDIPDAFETERLIVRCPRPGDGRLVYEALVESLDALRRFPASLPWALEAPSVERSELFCREGFADFVARRDFPFLIFVRHTSTLAGCCGLRSPDWSIPAFDIGWWGRASCLGQGLVTEAVSGLLDFAKSRLGARRIAAFVDERNVRSLRVCERAGMQLEGVLRYERIDPDGTLRDTCVYARVSE